jgi:hypothetical protein
MHLSTFCHELLPILRHPPEGNVVERINPESGALMHHCANAVRCVPLPHRARVIVVVMRIATKRIHTQHHSADFRTKEVHFRNLNLGSWFRSNDGRQGLNRASRRMSLLARRQSCGHYRWIEGSFFLWSAPWGTSGADQSAVRRRMSGSVRRARLIRVRMCAPCM